MNEKEWKVERIRLHILKSASFSVWIKPLFSSLNDMILFRFSLTNTLHVQNHLIANVNPIAML